jgi:uncharacterized protein (TIGR03437 family)
MKFSVLAGTLLISPVMCGQVPQYKIQDLGSLAGAPHCKATALSQSGNVVGYCVPDPNTSLVGKNSSPPIQPFLYSNGVLQDLSSLASQPTPLLTAVNDSGAIAGAFMNIGLETGASASGFVIQNGALTVLEGQLQSFLPFGLTDSGQMGGSLFQILGGNFNFFLHTQALLATVAGAKPMTLTLPPGVSGSGAVFGMSQANGWVAGAAVGPSAVSVQALLWQNSAPQLLPALSNSNFGQSVATAVNDSGMATGIAFQMDLTSTTNPPPGSSSHAVLYKNGTVTDLGVLPGYKNSLGLGINNSGWVVGFSDIQAPPLGLNLAPLLYPVEPYYRAFLYANGKMYDLSQLLTNGQGWQLTFATQINNAGQIIGTGIFQAQQRAFLLTPVGAPAGPVINAGGVVGAANSVPPITSISSNGLFTVYGTNFAPSSVSQGVTQQDLVNNALPTNLANTCVQVGASKAGMFFVSAAQINALAEDLSAVSGATVPVSVIANCGTANEVTSPAVNVNVAKSAPEFLYFVANANGQDPVAAIEATGPSAGQFVGPVGLITGPTFAPAHEGDVVTAFGVGWGATDSTDPIGTLASGAASLSGSYSLTVGDKPAQVSYAGLTPTFVGLYQVNFMVPTGLVNQLPVNEPLVLTVNGASTPSGAYITVGPL